MGAVGSLRRRYLTLMRRFRAIETNAKRNTYLFDFLDVLELFVSSHLSTRISVMCSYESYRINALRIFEFVGIKNWHAISSYRQLFKSHIPNNEITWGVKICTWSFIKKQCTVSGYLRVNWSCRLIIVVELEWREHRTLRIGFSSNGR